MRDKSGDRETEIERRVEQDDLDENFKKIYSQ